MAVQLQQFADRCGRDLPGIQLPLLNTLIVEIGRELCRDGRLWRQDNGAITLNGSGTYALTVPTGAVVHDIDAANIDGVPVDGIARDDSRLPSTVRYSRIDNGILIRPDCGGGTLNVELVLIPTPDATSLPDVLYNEWIEGVQYGVNAKAMGMAKKEWSDIFVPRVGRVRPGLSLQANQASYATWLAKARGYGRAGGATVPRRTADGFRT